jgi:chemotaxis protein methyltransferase CheR
MMPTKMSDPVLIQLSEVVASRLGLHFPRERWCDLQRAVDIAARECGLQDDLDRYIQELLSPGLTQRQLEMLANHLTVGETYFFREKRSLQILEEHIVPELIRARAGAGAPIRIWSAGCATGEEPYSVAIVLNRLMAALKDWNVEILATDLNTKSLQKASAGNYGEWSFRGTPSWVRHAYFEPGPNGSYTIASAIKKMVSFAPLNLMDDAFLPLSNFTKAFDVIFCRNVLMYFIPEGIKKVIRHFYRHLAMDGWLIVSPTETSHELFSEFATVSFDDVTLYRKSAARVPTTFALPEFHAARPVVQVAEWTTQAHEPARISSDGANPVAPDSEAGSERTTPPISYQQAMALYEQERYGDMEQVIAVLPLEDGNRASAMLLLARAYANQGKLSEALAWCDKAIAADKMAARAHYLRATILQERGSLPEALLALKQAVYAEPEFILGHFMLGNLALRRGRRKESQKHSENALLLLARYEVEDIVPESEGLSAGRLREMIAMPSSAKDTTLSVTQARTRLSSRIGNLELSRG